MFLEYINLTRGIHRALMDGALTRGHLCHEIKVLSHLDHYKRDPTAST